MKTTISMKKRLFLLLFAIFSMVIIFAETSDWDDGPSIFYEYPHENGIYYIFNSSGDGFYVFYWDETIINDGNLVIPPYVNYEGKPYPVIGLSASIWQHNYTIPLKSISVPYTVTIIHDGVFSENRMLEKLIWDAPDCTNPRFNDGILSIEFGSHFQSVPEKFCQYMENLESVICSDAVQFIGYGAFDGCTSLSSVTLPSSCTGIGSYAFNNCENLTSIVLPEELKFIPSLAFSNSGLTSIVIPDNVTSIGPSAFAGCPDLTTVTIGKNVSSIGQSAFAKYSGNYIIDKLIWNAINCDAYDFGSLQQVIIGDEVENIPANFCKNEEDLEEVTFGKNVKNIGESAFENCKELHNITLPETLTYIGERAFEECEKITSITIPRDVESIPYRAFFKIGIDSLVIPDNVTSIGKEAFAGCPNLGVVTIGKNVSSIGQSAFAKYSGNYIIYKLIWNAINCDAYDFELLEQVIIGDEVENIPANFCKNEEDLEEVTFGKNVKNIGQDAFYNCNNMASITSKATIPPTLQNGVFNMVNKSIPVYVPKKSIEAYENAFIWEDFYNKTAILDDDSETELPAEIPIPNDKAKKLIRNGDVYILTDDHTYTLTGQEVK